MEVHTTVQQQANSGIHAFTFRVKCVPEDSGEGAPTGSKQPGRSSRHPEGYKLRWCLLLMERTILNLPSERQLQQRLRMQLLQDRPILAQPRLAITSKSLQPKRQTNESATCKERSMPPTTAKVLFVCWASSRPQRYKWKQKSRQTTDRS